MRKLINIEEINPSLRKAGIQESPTYTTSMRINYDYEFIYCHHGQFTIKYNSTTDIISSHMVAIIPPAKKHRMVVPVDCQAYWIHFDFIKYSDQEYLKAIIEDKSALDVKAYASFSRLVRPEICFMPNQLLPNKYLVNSPNTTLAQFKSILALFERNSKYFHYTRTNTDELYYSDILSHLIIDSELKITRNNILSYIDEYISKNIHRKITVSELSDHFHYHTDTINRMFKQNTGLSISVYIQTARINHSKSLMQHSDLTIESIAELCGFNNRNHFSKTFKKIAGCCPSFYRSSYYSNTQMTLKK